MEKNSLYEEILSCAKDGYDTNGIVEEWINDEAFDLFYEALECWGDYEVLGINEEYLKKIIELSPSFFSDKVNIIYLKLLNLYEKIVKENGENQELFYVVDRFMPSQRELSLVEKNMQFPFNNLKTLISKFISRHVDIDWILKKYEDVSVYAKNVALVSATSENETNDIKEVISAVDENLTYYKSVDSDSGHNRITDILIDNYLENFEEKNLKIGIMNLASFYCSVFGSNLTSEEISLISREISEEENTLLSSVVQGKKR